MSEQPEQLPIPAEWESEGQQKPISIEDAQKEYDIGYPHVPASELKGESFIIRGARSFESSLSQDVDPFFCLCVDEATGELFTTVLGGKQPVEFLAAYVAKGGNRPLAVTLTFVEQGRYDGYYVIE